MAATGFVIVMTFGDVTLGARARAPILDEPISGELLCLHTHT